MSMHRIATARSEMPWDIAGLIDQSVIPAWKANSEQAIPKPAPVVIVIVDIGLLIVIPHRIHVDGVRTERVVLRCVAFNNLRLKQKLRRRNFLCGTAEG